MALDEVWGLMQGSNYDRIIQFFESKRHLISTVDENGYTPLTIALHQEVKQERAAQWLIRQGVDVNAQNSGGFNALILCCRYDMPQSATALINAGASLDLQTGNNFTAMMHAARHATPGMPGVVRLMIEKGASLDLRNRWGNTALMSGCYSPHSEVPNSNQEVMLECVKLLYAAGAGLDFRTSDSDMDALELSRNYGLSRHISFLEFVTNSAVTRTIVNELRLPKQLMVKLHEEGVGSLADCELIYEDDLKRMNCLSQIQTRKFMRKFHPGGKKRESRKLKVDDKYDAFLTHDWGVDELQRNNHDRVAGVNKTLKANGIVTWFDSDRMRNDVVSQILQGIQNSSKVVVFITERYMKKLETKEGVDFCRSEFLTATNVVGPQNMIPIVMEPRMLDQSKWTGPLQFYLGTKLYLDFTGASKVEANIDSLISRIMSS